LYNKQANRLTAKRINSSSKRTYEITACLLDLLVAYFQPANCVFLSHKSANNIFSRLFSTQANELLMGGSFFFIACAAAGLLSNGSLPSIASIPSPSRRILMT
jgi:hypothetical protein